MRVAHLPNTLLCNLCYVYEKNVDATPAAVIIGQPKSPMEELENEIIGNNTPKELKIVTILHNYIHT